MSDNNNIGPVYSVIRSRRVTRVFTEQPVAEDDIRTVLEAARWAPSGANRRLNVYVVVQLPYKLRQLRAVSPGILGNPPVVIVACIDRAKMQRLGVDDHRQNSSYVDVGTAMQNMLLTACELGLGACPVMSFHRAAVQLLLDLPSTLEPVLMILLGRPDTKTRTIPRPPLRLPKVDDFTYWEAYPAKEVHHE